MREGAIVVDCPRYPDDNYLGYRVVRTDVLLEDLGVAWFERRAENMAWRHAPSIPAYHLKITREPGFWPRYRIRAYENEIK